MVFLRDNIANEPNPLKIYKNLSAMLNKVALILVRTCVRVPKRLTDSIQVNGYHTFYNISVSVAIGNAAR